MTTQPGTRTARDALLAARNGRIRAMLARVRKIAEPAITRAGLARIRDELLALAAERDLFPIEEFPPIEGGNSSMYCLAEDPTIAMPFMSSPRPRAVSRRRTIIAPGRS